MQHVRIVLTVVAFVMFTGLPGISQAQDGVGMITDGHGEIVLIRASGEDEPGVVGSQVFLHDEVFVGPVSEATVTFVDNTILTLGAESALTIDEVVYDPDGQDSRASLNLAGGLMGLVSGDIVKTGDMTVITPVSTIGIRGTAVLIDSGFTVQRQDDGSVVFESSNSQGQVVALTISPDGMTGTVVVISGDGSQMLMSEAGQTLFIDNNFNMTYGQADSDQLEARFGTLIQALRAATGSDFVGSVGDVTAEQLENLEDAIRNLLDTIENRAQDVASPD